MALSEALKETIAYAELPTDDRGLLPLAVARSILSETRSYPGASVHKGRTPAEATEVAKSHKIHAALVSLDTAEEALGHLTRLQWGLPLYDGTTLVERYGAAMLPWFAGAVAGGELSSKTWELEPALALIGSDLAFELLLKLTLISFDYDPRKQGLGNIAEVPELDPKARVDVRVERAIDEFIAAQPDVAARVIGKRMAAEPKSKRPKELGKRLPPGALARALGGAPPVEPLTAKTILQVLDAAAKDPSPQAWPKFATGIEDDSATYEYFALRLLGVRSKTGEDWGVVLERITGSYSPHEPTRICRFHFGSRVRAAAPGAAVGARFTEHPIAFVLDRKPDAGSGESLDAQLDGVTVSGPAGKAKLSNALVKKHHLEPGLACELEGDAGFNLRLRAYLALHPTAFWDDASAVIEGLQLDDPEVLVDTHTFGHVVGSTYKRVKTTSSWHGPPSKSKTYKSLAEALVKRKQALFAPGESNLDARLHAVNEL